MESQSSSRPGLVASFKVRAACVSHSRMPMIIGYEILVWHNKCCCGFGYVWGFVGWAAGFVFVCARGF
jgi:hypothetical protein